MDAATTEFPCTAGALVLRLASVGFQYPDADWRERFPPLLAQARKTAAAPRNGLAALEKELRAVSPERLQAEHFRLFGPAPACPLDLAHHISPNPYHQPRRIADIAGFYKAFGVESAGRADHLPVVLEFMAYLEIKSAHAAKNGWDDKRLIADEAAASLRRDIVAEALGAFSRKLEQAGAAKFYLQLAALARLPHKEAAEAPMTAPGAAPKVRWKAAERPEGPLSLKPPRESRSP